jgi:hypothetical protein
MTPEQIAFVCHETNRAYCSTLGDNSQPPWDEAPEWQKTSAINGVLFHMENPHAGPEHSHEEWLKEKFATGWKYGAVKNPETREHPCIVPYSELPIEQRLKDVLFLSIVNALK